MRRVLTIGLAALACAATARAIGQSGGRASASPPARLEIGRPATTEEIAQLDIDVRADGRGLPPGRGTTSDGARVYREKCAACHGLNGEGMSGLGNPLIGRPNAAFDFALSLATEGQKTIGNYWPYATTLFDYVRRAMPFNAPGSLTDAEVYASTAYLLWKNGIIAEDAVMTAQSLPLVRMPAQPRFVRDDRERSKRVK
jgi:cytochrome c